MNKVNLAEKFALINEFWTPKMAGLVNDTAIKLNRLSPGEFVWHSHDNEDEMFLVLEGRLVIKFRDRDIRLGPGEFLIVPKGVEHMPVAETEVRMMLIEPAGTLNTGDVENEKTVRDLEWV